MDNLNASDVESVFQRKLQEEQRTQVNAAHETEEQFNQRFAGIGGTINRNLKRVEDFVEGNVFAGAPKQMAERADLDFSHDYVFTNVKRTVYHANQNAYYNIKKYGKAKPTDADKKRKRDIKGFFKKFTNAFIQGFEGKDADYQQAILDTARAEKNSYADKTTALELSRLMKYSDSVYKMMDQSDAKSLYSVAEKKALANVSEDKKAETKKEFFREFRFGVAPFLKNYRKKWFFGTKYYNLDGKRIKVDSGELTPEEYNKKTVEALLLETDNEKEKNPEQLRRNRAKKAVVLTRLTKEMLAYGKQFQPEKMTDLYVAKHIIELQEYYARLNAFHHLMENNKWFFLGNDKKEKQNMNEAILGSADPGFVNLVKTHILDMRFPVANFLEAHMRAHCLQSDKEFNKNRRKNYFRRNEVIPMVVIDNDYSAVDDLRIKEGVDLDELNSELTDQQEIGDRFTAFGCEFSVVDLAHMDAEDAEEYKKNLQAEQSRLNSGITVNNLANKLRKLRYNQTRGLSGEVTEKIKTGLDNIAKAAKRDVQTYNRTVEEDMKVPEVPYLFMTRAAGLNETVLQDLQQMKQKMHGGQGTVMYLQYGPEIDHIYAKMYTAVRLQGQFLARKKAIGEKFHMVEIRQLEGDLAKSGQPEHLRKNQTERLEFLKNENLAAMRSESRNPYASFAQDYLAEERLARAMQEYDEIDKKLEYTTTQIDLCKKTLDFFLTDPSKERMIAQADIEHIEKFLQSEKLGYMFEVSKLDDFDRILFDAVKETEQDLEQEAGNDAVRVEVRQRDKNYRLKASRVFQVRRRGRQAAETEQINNRLRPDAAALFTKLIQMRPEELSSFNYKGVIPVSSEQEKKQAAEHLELLRCVGGKVDKFNPVFYNNDRELRKFFRQCTANGILQPNASYARFKTDIRTKIDLLFEWSKYVNEVNKNQMDANYAYLDTDALEGYSIDMLRRMKTKIEARAQLLETEAANIAKEVAKSKPIKEDDVENGEVVLNLSGQEERDARAKHNIAYVLRKKKLDNCRLLITMLDRKIKQDEVKTGISELTSEAYYARYNRAIKDNEIDVARKWEYPAADETFLVLRRMAKSEAIAAHKKNELTSRVFEEKKKDPEYLNKDENLRKEATDLLLRVSQIKPGPELLELTRRLFDIDSHAVPEEHEILLLLRHAGAILDIENIMNANARFSDPAHVALKAYFERPENKAEYLALKNMYKIVEPLYRALDNYLQAHGITDCGSFSVMTEYADGRNAIEENENTSPEEKDEALRVLRERIESESGTKTFASAEAYADLKKNLQSISPEELDALVHEDWTKKLFAVVHEAGAKLDLSKQDAWKAIFTDIAKKGYYKKKPKKGEQTDPEKEMLWMKAAANQILARWPQSLEDFYIEHNKLVTGDALKDTFMRVFAYYDTHFVDATHSVEISEVISRKQQMIYQGVTDDKRRQLDEALAHAGYDPTVFKYLFEDVETNGAGQPVSEEASDKRTINMQLADSFIERNKERDGMIVQPAKRWHDTVMRLFKKAVSFKITSEMTEKNYIKKHFEVLYGEARKFAALKQIYEHEKELLDDPDVLKENKVTAQQATEIKNAFGPQTRSLYASYFEMLEAYAHVHFVDKEGRFDIGLTAEDLFVPKTKKDQKKRLQENTQTIQKELRKRDDHFSRTLRHVNAELDRDFLAQKVTKAEEANNTLKVIEIKGNANVTKMVQMEGFEGKLSDMNILLQTPEIVRTITKYNDDIKVTSRIYDEHQPLVDRYEILLKEGKGGTEEAEELFKEIYDKRNAMTSFEGQTVVKYFEITEQQKKNRELYNAFNECHKKDGTLNLYEVKEDKPGEKETIDRIEKYADFHAALATECAGIYRNLKKFFGDRKNLTKETFTAESIIRSFKKDEMENKLREYRKIDLYLGLLEADKKNFKTKDYDVMKSMGNYIDRLAAEKTAKSKELERTRKAKRNSKLEEGIGAQQVLNLTEQVKQLEKKVDDLKLAKGLMEEAIKDMGSTSATNPVRLIHDYVRLIFLSLKSYGVAGNGEIMEEQVKREAGDQLTEQERRDIAYDEADKIGDAHLELQHEINQRLGFERKMSTSKKGGK